MGRKKAHKENVVLKTASQLPSNLILFLRKTCIESSFIENETNIFEYSSELKIPEAFDVNLDKFTPISNNANDTITEPKLHVELHCLHCFSKIEKQYQIPVRKTDKGFECKGTFCSLSCACAYIMNISDNSKWTSYQLLHEMYDMKRQIKPSPDKECLKIFGGTLTNEEFHSGSEYHIVQHPFVSLKNDLDDVICRDTKSKTDVTQTDFAVEEDKDETVFKTKKDKKTSKTLEDFFAF
jgi:hypothetical protein